LEFLVKGCRVFDVLDRVGAEGVLELVGRKGQFVDAVDDDEVRDIGMFHDVYIDTPSVGLSTADVEIPFLLPVSNDPSHDSVAEEIESREQDDERRGGDE
jgi:hypothetical protein